jgi:hypothetical protein
LWSQEQRLLRDLETVCVDSEHGIYAVDLAGWAFSWGELPIRRQLPGHQEVVIVRRLRGAIERLRSIRVDDDQHRQLKHLFAAALEHREQLMRERFRPLLVSSLDESGISPVNLPEEIGRDKLVDELLDRVEENGHFSIGNLRDAISSNQQKLPDLHVDAELFKGDPIIRLNRKLAIRLDGVYRRGEIYMRLLHRLSSLAFGTVIGRLLVLFFFLPFGLAFFVMITPGIAIEEGEKLCIWIAQMMGLAEIPPELPAAERHAVHVFPIPNLWGVAALGIFFMLLFNVAGFRRLVFLGFDKVWRALHRLFVTVPFWVVQLPALQAILRNPYWETLRRVIFWPVVMAMLAGVAAWWNDAGTAVSAGAFVLGLAGGIVLLNTRLGRDIEENVTDWLLHRWAWLNVDLVPGVVRWIMDVSRWCLEGLEQMLYTVNESLRFRSGTSQIVIFFKAVLGLFWSFVTYIIRFAVNLLIEPQVNPIKHFPVVTVSHKVCLPMIPTLAGVLRNFGVRRATTTAAGIIFGIPGIFGFMVWEVKENWKLYRANRSRNLRPVAIGSHGETMLRLLRPGFHSGTVPKLFKKIRRAERHASERSAHKYGAALHHVAASIAHFVERDLLALLRRARGWGGLPIHLGHVCLATNRVWLELACPALGDTPLAIAIDQQGGWLLAGVLEPGWLPRLNAEQRMTLAAALAGLYKLAGVHLTREQIASCLPAPVLAYGLTEEGLMLWAGADGSEQAVYDLSEGPKLTPVGRTPECRNMSDVLPVLDRSRLIFAATPIAWDDWVHAWQDADVPDLLPAAALLPDAKS